LLEGILTLWPTPGGLNQPYHHGWHVLWSPSVIAYPVLRDGISAAVAINEKESHESVEYLQAHGIDAGPCGAATLASMRKYLAQLSRDKRRSMSVVLFSTEGPREYDVPP
jgi:diaminopropionate ammonia-lyase